MRPELVPAPDLPPLWDGPDTVAVLVARAALMEVGRPDLAAATVPNRAGMPSSHHDDADTPILVRAYLLGHLAEGHDAQLAEGGGIWCQECFDHILERFGSHE